MNKPLTHKQQRFLEFIQHFTLKHGQPPSYEEIMHGLRFSSPGTVDWYVRTLTDSGHLARLKGPNGKRALTVAPAAMHALPEPLSPPVRLPLLGLIAAGEPIEALENPEQVHVPAPFAHPDNFVLRVKGDSMTDDNIEDGDFIIVRKTPAAQSGQIVVALVNGEATLKRYYPRNGEVELHPRNPSYPVIRIHDTDHFRINGVVLYSFREY